MILNLNDPSKIEDTSWIKPMKYVGFVGNAWEIDLITQFTKCSKLFDTRIIAVRKTWSDY
jgi:hypothetical protein